MLSRFRIRGFKSWVDTGELRLAPITAFFGANSSGKSSILQALLLLKQTTESRDRNLVLHFGDDSTLVDLGDFASIAHKHNTESTVSFSIGWPIDRPTRGRRQSDTYSDIDFEVTFMADLRREGSSVVVDSMSYSLNGEDDNRTLGVTRDQRDGTYAFFTSPSEDDSMTDEERTRVPMLINFYGFPFDMSLPRTIGSLALDSEHRLRTLISNIRYLGPLRARPQRQYSWSGDSPIDRELSI